METNQAQATGIAITNGLVEKPAPKARRKQVPLKELPLKEQSVLSL